MSAHAEAFVPELDLNKETIQDLDVDAASASQIKGGAGIIIGVAPANTSLVQNPSGGFQQNPSGGYQLNPSGG